MRFVGRETASVEGGNTLGQVLATGGAIPNKRLTGQVEAEMYCERVSFKAAS